MEALVIEIKPNYIVLQLYVSILFRFLFANNITYSPDRKSFRTERPLNIKLRKGNIVSFSYHTFSGGIPIEPVILKVRHDISWENVVNQSTLGMSARWERGTGVGGHGFAYIPQ